jgi:hypothetical protein
MQSRPQVPIGASPICPEAPVPVFLNPVAAFGMRPWTAHMLATSCVLTSFLRDPMRSSLQLNLMTHHLLTKSGTFESQGGTRLLPRNVGRLGFQTHRGSIQKRYTQTEMAEISKQLSFEEAVREIMSRVSCSEDRARFIAAIERGEIDGDCIELDENGNEIKPNPHSRRVA